MDSISVSAPVSSAERITMFSGNNTNKYDVFRELNTSGGGLFVVPQGQGKNSKGSKPKYNVDDLRMEKTVKICFNGSFTFMTEASIVKKCSVLLNDMIVGDTTADLYNLTLPSAEPEHIAPFVFLFKTGVIHEEHARGIFDFRRSDTLYIFANANYLGVESLQIGLEQVIKEDICFHIRNERFEDMFPPSLFQAWMSSAQIYKPLTHKISNEGAALKIWMRRNLINGGDTLHWSHKLVINAFLNSNEGRLAE